MNRENIQKVRDVIAGLPPRRFDMSDYSSGPSDYPTAPELLHGCGTAACIAGWAAALADPDSKRPLNSRAIYDAQDWFGLDHAQADQLFCPQSISLADWHKITRSHAARVLDHLLATGEVDWKSTRRAKKAAA